MSAKVIAAFWVGVLLGGFVVALAGFAAVAAAGWEPKPADLIPPQRLPTTPEGK